MGGRQSKPRAPHGIKDISVPGRRIPRTINGRVRPIALYVEVIANHQQTLIAPLAAVTMACLLYVYSRTAINAAKLNAQKHREADGGQLNWRHESLRRHGQLDKIDDRSLLKEALLGNKEEPSETEQAPVRGTRGKVLPQSEAVKILDEIKARSKRSRREDE